MAKTKSLGRDVAHLLHVPAILSTPEAAEQDAAGAAIHVEQTRYERAILDFEIEMRKRRDAMHAEHLENMAAIFDGDAS